MLSGGRCVGVRLGPQHVWICEHDVGFLRLDGDWLALRAF